MPGLPLTKESFARLCGELRSRRGKALADFIDDNFSALGDEDTYASEHFCGVFFEKARELPPGFKAGRWLGPTEEGGFFVTFDVVEERDLQWQWRSQGGWACTGLGQSDGSNCVVVDTAHEIDELQNSCGLSTSASDLASDTDHTEDEEASALSFARCPWVQGYEAGFAAGRVSGLEEGQSMALVEAFVRGLSLAGDAPQASTPASDGGQASASEGVGSCPPWFKQGPKIWAGLSVDEKKVLRKVNFASEG